MAVTDAKVRPALLFGNGGAEARRHHGMGRGGIGLWQGA